ncbi:TldD/PmbA family protein [Candidatus Bipolaricaulota bacterium]|nr:TldD/PmbA family protein [Candidatus Bipolaricaulota bacterium]
MNNETILRERCREALKLTKSHGADEVEVFAQTVHSISADIEKHDLQTSSSQQETMVGIRALVNQQVGFACTNVLDDLEATCVDVVKLAKASPKDENNVFADPVTFEPVPDLYDSHSESFSVSDAVAQTIRMIEAADAIDPRLVIGGGTFSANRELRCIVTSKGVDLAEKASLFTYYALATAKDGEKVSNMAFHFDACHFVKDVNVVPVTARACQDALGSLGAQKGESFVGPVILAPTAVEDVLVGLFAFQLNAKNALRGSSRWGKSLGEAIAHTSLTVTDNGRLPGGVATRSFDREGMPHRELVLIDAGVAIALMHNGYTARAMGSTNTAHASGSARSTPGIGLTNLSIQPGNKSKDDLIADVKQGLLVNRFSGSSNPISGDFSGVAKAATLIKNGKLDRPVTGTLIAGNVFEVLKNLSGVSSETERTFAATLPYLRLEGISVTAE